VNIPTFPDAAVAMLLSSRDPVASFDRVGTKGYPNRLGANNVVNPEQQSPFS
jgi:hypothetical protein